MAIALSGCNTISSFACLYFRTYRMNTIYDFETMSQDPHTGAVLSFAMLNWNPKKLYTYSELVDSAAYIKFDVKEQVEKYNRVITKETVEWWSKQNKEAQKVIAPSKEDVSISELYQFYMMNKPDYDGGPIYTRRNTFDPVFMTSLCHATGHSDEPYKWWDIRDTISMIDGLSYGADIRNNFIPEGLAEHFILHDPRHDIAMDVMRMQTLIEALNA